MVNDRENNRQQPTSGGAENGDRDRTEQFNELSELSLEERMAVADQIGIPTGNVGEAAATGTISGSDDAQGTSNGRFEEERTGVEPDR